MLSKSAYIFVESSKLRKALKELAIAQLAPPTLHSVAIAKIIVTLHITNLRNAGIEDPVAYIEAGSK